jgi:hypothetical protein
MTFITIFVVADFVRDARSENSSEKRNEIKNRRDAEAEQYLKDPNKKELTDWLNESSANFVYSFSHENSLAMAKTLYGLGAKSLTAFKIDFDHHIVHSLLIEFPDDKSARRQLIQWKVEREKKEGFDTTGEDRDFGERYMLEYWDKIP